MEPHGFSFFTAVKISTTLRKFLKLLLEIEFYKIVIHLTFVATGYIDFSMNEFLWFLLPVHNVTNGFVSCFLVFFLCIPFLNVLIQNLDKQQHQLLILLSVGVFSLWNTVPCIEVGSNDSIWFCVLYFIASYLRLYPLKRDRNTRFWFSLLIIAIVTAMSSVIVMSKATQHGIALGAYVFVGLPSAPLALLVSICAFMFFKNLKIKQSRLINTIGGGTFGVLLIHANSDTMRHWLWRDVFDNAGHYATNEIYLHALTVPLIVFSVCSIIEYVRMKTIEKPLLNFVCQSICKYFPNAK